MSFVGRQLLLKQHDELVDKLAEIENEMNK